MIKFNAILEDEGISPADVKLVRHQDDRFEITPYQVWLAGDGRLEMYQRIQSRSRIFFGAKLLASFVATPLNETLFVGLFEIVGVGKAPAGLVDPISKQDVGGHSLYDLKSSSLLADYRGKLMVEWGKGYRAWVQRAIAQNKPVMEIKRTMAEPPFPGFLEFSSLLSDLISVPSSWRAALSSVSGIYLLTNPTTGKQYVGSASGNAGFWGRWEDYVASGHGGNRIMKELPSADYHVTILEVASSYTGVDELLAMESHWKQKLHSREFGLNAN